MRASSLRLIISGVAAALSLAAGCAEAAILQPGDAVAGHPGLTYADLMRQLIPDLAPNPDTHQIEGHLKTAPRYLPRAGDGDAPPDPVVLGFIGDQRIKVGGRKRIAVLADLGQIPDNVDTMTVLSLFDDSPRPKLLDAVRVDVDHDTAFSDHAQVPLGPGDDALITYSEHDDADLTFGHYVVIVAGGDRFRLVKVITTPSERACGWSDVENTTVSTKADPGRRYNQIVVAVSAVFKHPPGDCGSAEIPKGHSAVYRAAFRWNEARHRFETPSDGLERLDAVNLAVFH